MHSRWAFVMAALAALSQGAVGQDRLRISRPVWDELKPFERGTIQRSATVEIIDPSAFGQIMDAQGQDQSTPGSTAGSQLGGALGSAAYVDRAFSGSNNYSAKTHLAASLLGALVGSSLDSKGRTQYQFRYAVKLGSGQVEMLDEFRSDPFRQPPGLCVSVPNLTQIDQRVCTATAVSLRQQFQLTGPPASEQGATLAISAAQPAGETVECKAGTLPPVQTEAQKCLAIGGIILK